MWSEVPHFLNVNIILIIYCPTVNIILYCQVRKKCKKKISLSNNFYSAFKGKKCPDQHKC